MGLFGNSGEMKPVSSNKPSLKVTSFFETLNKFISYYGSIATVLGMLWGGFVMYDKWKDSNQLLQSNIKNIIETQKKQITNDSILLDNQKKLKIEVDNLKINGTTTIENMSALQRSYIRYISNDNALTKQEFLEYMEGLSVEEKKSSLETGTNK